MGAAAASAGRGRLTDAEVTRLRERLRPQEELRWCGRPNPAYYDRMRVWMWLIGLAVLVAGLGCALYFWVAGAADGAVPGVVLVAAAIAAVFFALVPVMKWSAGNQIYAVTSERALIVGGMSSLGMKAWDGASLRAPEVYQGPDGLGQVVFAQRMVFTGKTTQTQKFGFYGIQDPRGVAAEIERLRAEAKGRGTGALATAASLLGIAPGGTRGS